MIYDKINGILPPRGKILFACAYHLSRNGVKIGYNEKPYKCIIRGNIGYRLRRDGTESSRSVYLDIRCFADTYQESVKQYNELIEERLKILRHELYITKNHKINITNKPNLPLKMGKKENK